MEFLKEILGEELYAQVESKINEHNSSDSGKENPLKIGNVNGYVEKSKYDALNEQLGGKQSELDTANTLISDLKKNNKGNEDLQAKITGYETDIADLQSQLAQTKLKSAVKVALMSENAADVDYLTFKLNEKLKEKNETLELDENDNIKGWDSRISELKTAFPNMFNSDGKAYKVLGDNSLPKSDDGDSEPQSLAEALCQRYENE